MLTLSRVPKTPPSTLAPVLDPASLQRLHELDPQGDEPRRRACAARLRSLADPPVAAVGAGPATGRPRGAAPCGAHAEVVVGQCRCAGAVARLRRDREPPARCSSSTAWTHDCRSCRPRASACWRPCAACCPHEHPHELPTPSPTTPAAKPPEVLLVDDDEVNLLLTAVALRERGFAHHRSQQRRTCAAAAGRLGARHHRARRDDARPGRLRHLPRAARDARLRERAGADAHRPGRRRVDHPRLPGRRHRLLRQVQPVEPAGRAACSTCCAPRARAWSWSAARPSWRARKTWRAWAASTGAAPARPAAAAADAVARGPARARLRPGRPRSACAPSLRMVPRGERRSDAAPAARRGAHSSVLATDVPVTLLDGRQRIIHVEAEPEFNEHGHCVGYTGIVQDVTDRRVAEDRIRHLANFDALTGLPNRRQLIWRIERAIEHARRLGHQVRLPADRPGPLQDHQRHARPCRRRRVADGGGAAPARLRAPQRPGDGRRARVAWARARTARSRRWAGWAATSSSRCCPRSATSATPQRVADAHPRSDARPDLRRRAGVFRHRQRRHCDLPARRRLGGRPDAQLRRRDVLGQVAGRNASALYSPQLAGRGREKLELESALHKAIERDELVLHYQPKIDVRSARMVGAEALMRWQRGGTLVPPGDFIPLAEETGPDRAAVRMGAARGGAPGAALAGQLRLRRFDRREPAEPVVRALRPGRAHPPGASRPTACRTARSSSRSPKPG